MKVKQIIERLKVMLAAEEVKLEATAKLVDGTEVYSETEIVADAVLYVVGEDGEKSFAPAGVHQTEDGNIVTVGEEGVIVSVEKVVDEPEVEDVEVEVEQADEKEAMLQAISEIIKPMLTELSQLKAEQTATATRLSALADQPSASPIKSKTSQKNKDVDNRLEILKKIRKGK
jgi:hypothetical protein